jgi:anhydro-N-acetylmuramic acid kinase
MNTFTEHIAIQIALALPNKKINLFITGGGAYNDFMIERVQFHLKETKIVIPERKIIEFKEALIFGLLGVLKLRNEINTFSSVTGAKTDHSSGKIYI